MLRSSGLTNAIVGAVSDAISLARLEAAISIKQHVGLWPILAQGLWGPALEMVDYQVVGRINGTR